MCGGKKVKIRVATTSTGCLDYYDKPNDIDIIRIKIIDGAHALLDGDTIKADEFYERLRNNPSWVPKTSQPAIGEVVEYFESLIKDGYEEVFVTTISNELSGTINAIKQAAEIVSDRIKVTVYDTKTVCFSEGYFALEVERLFKEGKKTEDIILHLDRLKENNTIFFAVDDLTQLVNNGRLTGAKAFFGKLLKVKPILQVQGSGKILAVEKTRNFKKSLALIAEYIRTYTAGRKFFAHLLYTGNPVMKEYFKTVLKDELGIEGIHEAPATPVVGAHIGPDVVGIGVFLID